MSTSRVNPESLIVAIGASVLQWGVAKGFGNQTVSEFYGAIANGNNGHKVSAKKSGKKTSAKKTSTKKTSTKKTGVRRKTPKTEEKSKLSSKKKVSQTPPRKRSKKGMEGDPTAVVKFVKKHGSVTATDLKGLVPENPNARSIFMAGLISQGLIRREGKARGTTYLPA